MAETFPSPAEVVGGRIGAQLRFLVEVDQLKAVTRANTLVDGSRKETSAEHSWHVALMALVLCELAEPPLDATKVVAMLLVHDIVEVDAGDTDPFDDEARATKQEKEEAAADRIFALLPADQAAIFRAWWDEFEAAETPEAQAARAFDRFDGLVGNHAAAGNGAWAEPGRTVSSVRRRNEAVADWLPGLAPVVAALIDDAEARGRLRPG